MRSIGMQCHSPLFACKSKVYTVTVLSRMPKICKLIHAPAREYTTSYRVTLSAPVDKHFRCRRFCHSLTGTAQLKSVCHTTMEINQWSVELVARPANILRGVRCMPRPTGKQSTPVLNNRKMMGSRSRVIQENTACRR